MEHKLLPKTAVESMVRTTHALADMFKNLNAEHNAVRVLIREHLDQTEIEDDSDPMAELRKMYWNESDTEKRRASDPLDPGYNR